MYHTLSLIWKVENIIGNITKIWVKESSRTWFSLGWQGCSLGVPSYFSLGKSLRAALPALGKPCLSLLLFPRINNSIDFKGWHYFIRVLKKFSISVFSLTYKTNKEEVYCRSYSVTMIKQGNAKFDQYSPEWQETT